MDFDFTTETITLNSSTNLLIAATGAMAMPAGTTAQRPSSIQGLLRYNTSTLKPEYYNGTAWLSIAQGISIAQLINGTLTPATGTTTVPYDGTAPASTEGTLVWTQAITPSSTSSKIKIDISTVIGFSSNNAKAILSIFRGTTNIGTTVVDFTAAGLTGATVVGSSPASFIITDSPASVAATTYTMRIGSSTGTWFFGRSAQTLGNAAAGSYTLMELL